jgi:hypothetical protein
MEKINTDNYEAWFLDYHEGSLSAEEVAELMLFLEIHPGLKEEFEEFENVSLDSTESLSVFSNKESLRKPLITLDNYECYFVDASEGTLDKTHMQAIHFFLLENPELEPEYKACCTIRLIPNTDIVFENRATLYKTEADYVRQFPETEKVEIKRTAIIRMSFVYTIAAAASLALVIGIWLFYSGKEGKQGELSLYTTYPLKERGQAAVTLQKNTGEATERISLMQETPVAENTLQQPAPKEYLPEPFQKDREHAQVLTELAPISPSLSVGEEETKDYVLKNIPPPAATPYKEEQQQQEFVSLKEYAATKLMNGIFGSEVPAKGKKHPGWGVAKTVARGFNRISGKKIQIREQYDNNGELMSYALNSGNLEYVRAVKQP